MSYLVISRKYRPSIFDTVIGQQHVTQTLKNAISRNRIGHAYLFTGPRGVGKTSIARIFAKALNCQTGPTVSPCGECIACQEIAKGISLSVLEIDGASHNSVDNVRELIETFRSLPPPGYRYKVYIIDEVHMLSISAFNALLKSLEEPPANTVFILATTEVHKIPETVLSRCQRHDLRALTAQQIYEKLTSILEEESIDFEKPALNMIAKAADGSLRDGQSLLERIISYCNGKVAEASVVEVLGLVEKNILFGLSSAVFSRDPLKALQIAAEVFAAGVDAAVLLRQFVVHFRECLVIKYASEKEIKELSLTDSEILEFKRQIEPVSGPDLQDLLSMALNGADQALRSFHVKYSFEALLVRMASREPVFKIATLLEKIERGGVGAEALSASFKQSSGSSSNQSTRAAYSYKPSSKGKLEVTEDPSGAAPRQQAYKSESAGALDWNSFVSRVVASGGERILSEQLKQLVVDEFSTGTLKVKGSDFVVKYLQGAASKSKLEALLKNFAGGDNWKIDFKPATEKELTAAGTSIFVEERKQEALSRSQKENLAKEHPALKNLQSVFPGSVIEDIKIR